MEGIREYLITVICAAILCGIAVTLIGKKSAYERIVRLISGLCMAITVVSPLLKIRLDNMQDYFQSFSQNADGAVADGEEIASAELAAIIKERTEAYILDKAVSLNLDIEVEVRLNCDSPPIPCAVTITGSASPYAKRSLKRYISNDLGISEEDQIWI